MKKESNMGLLFLMAVGIVGLGLYYGATDNYGSGEIQLYHFICWIVLIIALLRALELVWEPVKFFWDQAWGKVQESRKNAADSMGNAPKDVLSGEEMQTSIIVPDAGRRFFAEREYAGPVREAAAARESVLREEPVRESVIRENTVRENTVREDAAREGVAREGIVREGAVCESAVAPAVIITPPPAMADVYSEEKKKKNKKKKK